MTGTHESFDREEEIKGSSDRVFGLVFVVVFTLVGIWPWILGTDGPRVWSLVVAAALLVAALAVPRLLAPANRLWMKFGLLLHRVTNPLIMGLLFYLTVTPTALIMRALGKDPLSLRLDPEARTYWIDRDPPGPSAESMTDQF